MSLPEALPYHKLTHINYAFGSLHTHDTPAKITFDEATDKPRLLKTARLAQAKGVKVLISLGGWTGSQTFSTIVRDATLRAEFIENAMRFVDNEFGLDGIDIDWEYPGRKGVRCNVVSKGDSQNYLLLLKELRLALNKAFPGRQTLITAAVRTHPFDGSNGRPLTDVSEYAKYFDFINIMAYDIFNALSNTTGPNAPFHQDPTKVQGEMQSFTQSIDDWIAAGFPAHQITAGVPFYGHSFTTTVDMSLDPTNQYTNRTKEIPKGDDSDAPFTSPVCDEGTSYSGVFKYSYLRRDILIETPQVATSGYTRYWDNVTLTPWLFNKRTNHYISYEDKQSIKIKVRYARCRNLLGMMVWELCHDYKDELIEILNSFETLSPPPAGCEDFYPSKASRYNSQN
ncbi:hypothetical protein L0F63_000338 [Massospora cicadina]|nr:hypothetical protein L0F63_000338 [Massospora cicadina]